MSIRAKQIDVPETDPFQYDLLERRRLVLTLADTLVGTHGPAVFSIDGAWGTGKTTFVRMLAQVLKKKGVNVVSVNAWETDYSRDPLNVLSASLLRNAAISDAGKSERFKKAASRLMADLIPATTKGVLKAMAPGGELVVDNLVDEISKLLDRPESASIHGSEAVQDFRTRLKDLSSPCEGMEGPLVVIVDELDRCRPDYAVSMLEIIKHFFDTEGVVFLLAVNRSQLDESVRTLYGTVNDPESYFRRFFDVELRLSQGDTVGFAGSVLSELGLKEPKLELNTLNMFLSSGPYSLRFVDQTIRLYGLVESGIYQTHLQNCQWMLVTAILLRLIDEQAYSAFNRNEISDLDLADKVFEKTWTSPMRETQFGQVIEATLAVVRVVGPDPQRHRSKLWQLRVAGATTAAPSGTTRYFIQLVEQYSELARAPEQQWHEITQRIEILDSSRA